ncbi:MAG: Na/Pi cotransporter family protein [Lentisphaeria bacterium]
MKQPNKYSVVLLLCCFLLCCFCFTGCVDSSEVTPSTIQVEKGDAQVGFPGEKLETPVVLKIYGPDHDGRRTIVRNIAVTIESVGGHDGKAVKVSGKSDYSGEVEAFMQFGSEIGDQYFKAYCPNYKKIKPVYFRIVSGIKIFGNNQQIFAGNALDRPIQIKLFDGKLPCVNVPVFFSLHFGPKQAKLSQKVVLTDDSGVAEVMITTAKGYTGQYQVRVEVGNPLQKGAYHYRGLSLRVLSMSRLNLTIAILGGLALFIFGMTLMSDGLQLIAGNRLKNMLQMFTANRVSAVLAGMGITALIQSSSACSVMVVGFVNAGLLSLNQAIGVIFGSAIGTTVTAQMISFKLDALALPAICIGVVILLVTKQSRTKGIAYTILGFGLLFFGMMLMSSELKVISDFPSFKALFYYFDCTPKAGGMMPLGAVLGTIFIGTILTIVVQSSSATVGLAIALAQSGLLNFYTAVPLILGDNIGTTITGLLASINTNRTAKQAAVAATIFKVLGVIIMIVAFYIPWHGKPCFLYAVDFITSGDVFAADPENIGRHLASAHTLFNLLNVFLFLPFIALVAKLSKFIVPDLKDHKNENRICYLEEHLLFTPTVALDQVLTALLQMTHVSMKQSSEAIHAFLTKDRKIGDELNTTEKQIDMTQHDIINYLVKLTRHNLSEEQSAAIPVIMHCVNDVERIGDRAINIFDLIQNMEQLPDDFSDHAVKEIRLMSEYLQKSGDLLIEGMMQGNQSKIDKVIKHLGEVKQMVIHFEDNHEVRLNQNDCTVEKGVIYVELLSNLERIVAHLNNIAERSRKMLAHKMIFNFNHLEKK